jgi:GNAT superfamily N-acetyltransferase
LKSLLERPVYLIGVALGFAFAGVLSTFKRKKQVRVQAILRLCHGARPQDAENGFSSKVGHRPGQYHPIPQLRFGFKPLPFVNTSSHLFAPQIKAMSTTILSNKVTDTSALAELRRHWRESLTGPQDGMWEIFRDTAEHWVFTTNHQAIGYACANEEHGLMQFYLSPEWQHERVGTLQRFLQQEAIAKGIVGTNNPVFLSAALELMQSVEVDTYLFTDQHMAIGEEKPGDFVAAKEEDLDRLIDFYHQSIGAPKSWLHGYLGNHLERGELFFLKQEDIIIGACEVRKSDSNNNVADLGMVVSPDFRRQGYGTFLLGKAKGVAQQWSRTPICSCEKDNIGSTRSIQQNGFRSMHQLLRVTF